MVETTMMPKKPIIFLGIITCLLLILAVLQLIASQKHKANPLEEFAPTPTPIGGTSSQTHINTKNPISVESTDPEDGAINIAVDKTIHVTFSRPIDPSEVTFVISPPFSFKQSVANNVLTINPSEKLSQYTTYTFFISFTSFQPSANYTFTTVSPNPSITPIEGDAVREHSDQNNKIDRPDVFLSNQTPYSTNSFRIEDGFTPYPQDHFFFTVTLNTTTSTPKQDFINWLRSLTLSDDQIKQLDIRYQ